MIDRPVTLAAVDEFIAARHKGLAFPSWLENRLEQDTQRRRALRLRAAVVPFALVYNLFLLPDILLIPDQMKMVLILHFAFVTPWVLFTGWLTTEKTPKLIREALAGSIPVVVTIQILCCFCFTESEHVGHYQYYVLIILLFTNTVQRLPFRYAVAVSCIILTCHALVIWISGQMSTPAAMIAAMTLTVSAYLTLISNYYLERDGRRAFLHTLRHQLNHVEVEFAANHDALTGLANRHHLAKQLTALWQQDGDDTLVAVIMIDVDHFKAFNDHYGHGVGDACLKRIAACASAALRNHHDVAVRHGGEELLLLLPQADLGTAIRVANDIRSAVENLRMSHEAIGDGCTVSISCGVAAGPVATVPAAELISAADTALYAAKRNGRNQVWPQLPQVATAMREAI